MATRNLRVPGCGWRGRLEIYATNKKQTWKEVAVMAEARDIEEKERNKKQ